MDLVSLFPLLAAVGFHCGLAVVAGATAVLAGGFALRLCGLRTPGPLRATDAFAALSLGLLFLALASAIVLAQGRTVLWGCAPPLAVTGWLARGRGMPASASVGGRLGYRWLVASATLAAAWQGFATFRIGELPLQSPNHDLAFYASVAEGLGRTGIEGLAGLEAVLAPSLFQARQPYHYAELWLAAGLSAVTGQSCLALLSFAVPALLLTAMSWGLLAVSEALLPPSRCRGFLALLLTLFAPCVPRVMLGARLFAEVPVFTRYGAPAEELKLLPAYVLATAVVLCVLTVGRLSAWTLMSAAIALHVGATALTIAALILLGLAVILRPRERRQASVGLVGAASGLVFVVVFYLVEPSGARVGLAGASAAAILARTLRIGAKTSVQMALAYGPILGFALGLGYRGRAAWRPLFLVAPPVVLAYIAGLLLWGFLSFGAPTNAVQFFTTSGSVLATLAVLLSLVVACCDPRARSIVVGLAAGLAVLHAWPRLGKPLETPGVSERYFAAVAVRRPRNPIGGSLLSEERVATGGVFAAAPRLGGPGRYLALLPGYLGVVPMVPLQRGGSDPSLVAVARTLLSARSAEWSASGCDSRITCALELIRTYQIDFVAVESGATVPSELWPYVGETLSDPTSGESILYLEGPDRRE